MLSQPLLLFTGFLSIQFFDSPKHSQLGYLWLPTPHYAAPMRLTGYYTASLVTRCFPTQPLPREVEDFPRGDRYFKNVTPLTYLIYLSPKMLYVPGLFKRYCYLALKYNVSYEI